ncbi:MAG TPA: tannase/feruloyl esterase family alpha/beta hydrolase [Bryobacteraceae bacterium]|nr:tannase/feruloyl esterase family alpha/beta hydrolase [Bryobacteraceae bacterium]
MYRLRWLAMSCFIWPAITFAQSSSSSGSDAQRCAALLRLDLKRAPGGPAVIASARLVDAPDGVRRSSAYPSGFSDGQSWMASRILQYCDVNGYVAPQNRFELKLPLARDWNGKFFFDACGGFCGSVIPEQCDLGLMRGYASATGNGGHYGAPGFDGAWAANAPELQEDFGWRSNHVVTLIAKAITTQYYGRAIQYSYMAGNSKGGQAVLMEAQRFPDDYDGYMPSAPVYDYTGRNIFASAWFAQAISDGRGGTVLDVAAAQAVHASVLEHCGAQSGVEEGVVTEPLSCNWQPELVACRAPNNSGCLNARQVEAVKRLMMPPKNSKGEVIYAYPYIPGTETQWEGWNYYGAPRDGIPPRLANLELPVEFERFMVDEKIRANVDPLHYDFEHGPATLARSRRIYDALSADLHPLKARGGKILLWHGWADGAIIATSSIGYYQQVTEAMGGRKQTEEFFRLFLIPGVHHGGGGPGFSAFDAFTVLEKWVENGQPPDRLIATMPRNGAAERSRPVFPYPVVARYSGAGDPKQAQSFVPYDPSAHP